MEDGKMLTLEKFEEASEVVKRVIQETKLVYSEYFSSQSGNRVYFNREHAAYRRVQASGRLL